MVCDIKAQIYTNKLLVVSSVSMILARFTHKQKDKIWDEKIGF